MATPGPSTVPLLARVRVAAGVGIVRFVGQTAFAGGKWIGIELDDEGTGKNDGSVQGKQYFELRKAGSISGVFVRPSQVHIIDARPQDEYEDSSFVQEDVSLDEIQNETIPEDHDTFVVPQPPKTKLVSRPSSVASSSARSSLISPPPSTPSVNRRLSARPASRVTSTSSSALASPSASPRPSLGRPPSSTPAARPIGRPTPTSRISSTSSIASTTSTTRRESALPASGTPAASLRTPGRPLLSARTASQHAPATPRPSADHSASLGSARRSITPRTTAEPQAAEMTRGISSSSSHSSLASASRLARPLSRPASKAEVEPPIRTLKSPVEIEEPDNSPRDTASDVSPEYESAHRLNRQTKQSVEEARFSVQPATSAPASQIDKQPLTVPARLYEELQLKFKLLENGRTEDRERLKELEKLKEDAESWNLARPKLQNKMIELSNEVKELRRQIKDDEAERLSNEKKIEDLNDQLEMEFLDKEVAEEKYEELQSQLESTKEKVAELEVELEVLRKEEARIVSEAGEGLEAESGDVKSSLAFIQLAKQNERLKEALVRLRDMTTENEQDYKRRIADLEKELDLTSDLQAAFDTTLEQLEQAESMVENLKVQLDDATGAEDMLEHLTERNLTLSERIEEMHAVIQDLEALKELNDELEENHIENEQHMQEEIDLRDHQIREYQKQLDNFEDSMVDYEGTISQFRELVINLQNDLEQLREQQQAQQSEKASLSSHSQAMLNLNMKLQSTVVRNQSKAVDFEFRKFEAAQARQQLQMVIPYLPSIFQEDDKAAIDAFLFFNRLVCKTQILIHTLDQTHGLQDGAYPETIPEALVTACETRWRLARFMILCKRFTANLQRCDPQIFVRMGKVYVEMLNMEKRIDAFINSAKMQELKEAECGDEIDRFLAQAAHIAELHIGESGIDLGEQHLGQTMSVDYDLDTFIAGVGHAKQALALAMNDPDVVFESGDVDIDEAVFARLQSLIDAARAIKLTTRKLVRRLEEVADSSASLRQEVVESFPSSCTNVRSISSFANKLATLVSRYTLEVRTSKDPFVLGTFFGIIQEAAVDIRSESKDLLGVEVILHNLKQKLVPALTATMERENVIKVTYEEPWIVRAAEMHRNAARDEEAERKVIKLTEDIRDLSRELRLKDQNIQESAVKIELLQKRMESGKKQADSAAELDAEVTKLKEQENEYEQTITQLQKDLDSLERENAKLKQTVPMEKNANALDTGEFTTSTGSLETSHLVEQIESLRGTVRYLRHQNSHLKSQGLFKDFYRLPTYETVVSDDQRETRSREFAEESNALLKQVASLSSRARVVDVSKADSSKAWQPLSRQPAAQLAAKRQTLEKLKARIDKLAEDKKEISGRRGLPAVVRL